jgi:hypothetical protein
MVRRKLNETISEMYKNGLIDETFVMEAITHTLGGTCEKSSREEDMHQHIDFWWNSPKKGRIGIDVKGVKKKNRQDKEVDDTIHWIEIQNVNGKKGWIYGSATYIAFRTLTQIIFVKTSVLQNWSEYRVLGKPLVYSNPKNCYTPYQRWRRQDIVYKIPTEDLINLSDFIIDC